MSFYYQLIERQSLPDGGTLAHYLPSAHARGVWNPHEQHMAPATGIICAELEQFQPRDDLRIGSLTLDILGLIHLKPFSIRTRLLRPGRTIELLEASLEAEGQTCITARAWRMQTRDTSAIAGLEDPQVTPVAQLQPWGDLKAWGEGYISTLECRTDEQRRAGRGLVWMTNPLEMIEGRETSAFVRLMGMVDTSNGTACRVHPGEWIFPNLDLHISLLRMPQGRWLGLDTRQQFGADGIGITSSVLHDELGMFGRSEQTLTLRPAR